MKKFNYAFAAVLTVAALSNPTMAKDCHKEMRKVEKKERLAHIAQGRHMEVKSQYDTVQARISSINSSINSAKHTLLVQKQNYNSLVYTFENADKLIEEYNLKDVELNAELVEMEKLAAELKAEYKDMWRINPLRLIKKNQYKNKLQEIEEQKTKIEGNIGQIDHVNNVVENFTTLEAEALTSIDSADDRVRQIINNTATELNDLTIQGEELYPRLVVLRSEEKAQKDELRRAQRGLKQCEEKQKREAEARRAAQAEREAQANASSTQKPQQGSSQAGSNSTQKPQEGSSQAGSNSTQKPQEDSSKPSRSGSNQRESTGGSRQARN